MYLCHFIEHKNEMKQKYITSNKDWEKLPFPILFLSSCQSTMHCFKCHTFITNNDVYSALSEELQMIDDFMKTYAELQTMRKLPLQRTRCDIYSSINWPANVYMYTWLIRTLRVARNLAFWNVPSFCPHLEVTTRISNVAFKIQQMSKGHCM